MCVHAYLPAGADGTRGRDGTPGQQGARGLPGVKGDLGSVCVSVVCGLCVCGVWSVCVCVVCVHHLCCISHVMPHVANHGLTNVTDPLVSHVTLSICLLTE